MRQQLITNNQIAKKSLGQNFITNNKFLLEMNKFIESSNNNILIEIGPGKGALTGYLTKKKYKKLYLIEKDYLLASRLKETYKNSNNIIVIQGDALSYNYNKFLNESDRVVIYGNLPFNISTRLLSLWLGSIKWPSFYDRRLEIAMASRLWVHIKERREPPKAVVGIDEAVVLQVIIRVGDKDVEGHSRPKLMQICPRSFTDHPDRLCDLCIGPLLCNGSIKSCAR